MVPFASASRTDRWFRPIFGVVLGLVASTLMISPLGSAHAQDAPSPPASPHGTLDLPCAQCHSPEGWKPARIARSFDHGAYGFPLTGAHAAADCGFCHRSLEFEDLDPRCRSCHQDVHSGSFGTDCAQCHGSRSFIDRSDQLAMHQVTRFPLTGRHGTLDCDQCHGGATTAAQFSATSTDCFACHRIDFETAAAPDHVQAGFGRDCSECHGTVAWSGAGVGSHDFFPLVGGHAGVDCQTCHTSGQFSRIDASCVACHRPDYDATVQPAHAAAGFTTDCAGCHTVQTWHGGAFDHASTDFALTGAHVGVDCTQCHTQATYAATPSDCNGCHSLDYAATTDPNHVSARLPFDCTLCHSTAAWEGASFDHALSSFPLTGAHQSVECAQCHVGGVYTGTRSDCYACHRPEYDATSTPAHAAAGFGTECSTCHTTIAWEGAVFDHSLTAFALTGAHRTVDCTQCHVGDVFAGTQTDCFACHRTDYDATTNPAHVPAGFGTDCVACHDTNAWTGARFDHDSNWFPIYTGRHATEWNDCADCHVNPASYGVYDCLNCHPHSDKAKVDGDHRGENGYRYDSVGCYECHPRGHS